MDRDQYFVVLHKGEWKIKHSGRHSHPYETQADSHCGSDSCADGSIL